MTGNRETVFKLKRDGNSFVGTVVVKGFAQIMCVAIDHCDRGIVSVLHSDEGVEVRKELMMFRSQSGQSIPEGASFVMSYCKEGLLGSAIIFHVFEKDIEVEGV